jgi:hypothetical protein
MVACRKPCDPWGFGRIQPFGQCEIRTMATFWEGVFRRDKGVLRRARERGMAGRASERLDLLSTTVLAIANKTRGSEHRCCRRRSTVDWDRRSPRCSRAWGLLAGFSPHARGVQEQALALHSTRQWRRDDRQSNRLGSGAMPQTGEPAAPGSSS